MSTNGPTCVSNGQTSGQQPVGSQCDPSNATPCVSGASCIISTGNTYTCVSNGQINGGGGDNGSGGGLYNPLRAGTNLETLVNDILGFIVQIGAIVVTLMLVYTGFKYVQARGNSSKLAEVHNMLLYVIIGALILLGAQALSSGIQATVQALSAGH